MATPAMLAAVKKDRVQAVKTWWGTVNRCKYSIYIRCTVQDEILQVSIFWHEYMRAGSLEPFFRVFLSAHEKRWVTYCSRDDKWLTAKVDRLPWPACGSEIWSSTDDDDVVKNYLGTSSGGYAGILEYQQGIRAEELKRRHKRITDPWDQDLARTPPLPKDWDRWVSKVGITENYMFYRYRKHGAKTGYCTYCNKWVPIRHPRYNGEGACPRCRHEVTYKSVGKVGNLQTGISIMYLLQRCQDGFIIREFRGRRHYSKWDEPPSVWVDEVRRTIYDEMMNPRSYVMGWYANIEYRWIATVPCSPNYPGLKGKIYGRTLPSLGKHELSRTGLPEMLRSVPGMDPEKYLAVFAKVPQLEQLVKAGLTQLAHECLDSCDSFTHSQGIINQGTRLTQMLGINTKELKCLRKNNGNVSFLEWIRYEHATGKEIPDQAISWFSSKKIRPKHLKFIRDRMSMYQVYHYMLRQMAESKMDCWEMIEIWKDYLSMAFRCKMDINDAIVYRTKKLRQRHDELVQRCNNDTHIEVRLSEAIVHFPTVEKICLSIKERFDYGNKDFLIRAPHSLREIIEEGEALNHCVAHSDVYFERIEEGESYILFLRRAKKPDEPFYSLEVEPDGTVRQKRSNFNRQPEIEIVDSFLAEWQGVVEKRLGVYKLQRRANSFHMDVERLCNNRVLIFGGALEGRPLADVLMDELTVIEDIAA